MMPINVDDDRLITEVAVSVLKTFCSSRSTPPLKTSCSRDFGVVTLHHPHSAQRFGEAAGDFGVDLGALAEDGTDHAEGLAEADPEDQQEGESDGRHHRADVHEHRKRDDRGQQSAYEVDQSGADEVAHALDVAHDARDQHAGLVGVVVGDGEPAHVLLHPAAQLGDQLLRGFGERLGQGERGQALNQGRREHDSDQRIEQMEMLLADDVVDQILGGSRQHQAGDAVDHHQPQAEAKQGTARADELPDLRQRLEDFGFLPRC